VPRYRPTRCGAWELRLVEMGFASGYWSGPQPVRDMAALVRSGEIWMSISPLEIESQEIGIRHARGHVLIHGLGMGWAAAACAFRPEVTRVTVVERDPEVLGLHRTLDVFAQLPALAAAKLSVTEGDAFDYAPESPVDLLMPDIWPLLVSDGRLDEVREMQSKAKAQNVYFWGQELELARHAAAAGRALDRAGLAATIAETGVPLIGADVADYAAKTAAAAAQWMRGRWLP
jgi:hypothetical protein